MQNIYIAHHAPPEKSNAPLRFTFAPVNYRKKVKTSISPSQIAAQIVH